jgi:hypothetical protein
VKGIFPEWPVMRPWSCGHGWRKKYGFGKEKGKNARVS